MHLDDKQNKVSPAAPLPLTWAPANYRPAPGPNLPVLLHLPHLPDPKMSSTELLAEEEGRVIYSSNELSINLYLPLFYIIAPLAFLLVLWQISLGASSLDNMFESLDYGEENQFQSLDFGPTGGGEGYTAGMSSGSPVFNSKITQFYGGRQFVQLQLIA